MENEFKSYRKDLKDVSFEYSKDLNADFTQYYDLIYTYQTDCISFNLNW